MSSGDISYGEYWTEIESLVRQAFEEAREYEREPYECLWETLDGHQWVIYTAYNFDVLKQSQNDGYALDNWGADGVVNDGQIDYARLAYGAMLGDCLEHDIPEGCDWNEVPEPEEEAAEA